MENDVITKPYAVDIDITADYSLSGSDDAFLLFIDRDGRWRVNTVIHGLTKKLGALCSKYSTTDDMMVIGKRKEDMMLPWTRMKEIGGGIVLAHQGEIIYELSLPLAGSMFDGELPQLIK